MEIYNEQRRLDPEIRAKVAKVVDARHSALEQANKLVQEASSLLRMNGIFVGDDIYLRQMHALSRMSRSLAAAAKISNVRSEDRESYIDHLAEGLVGAQVENMGKSFPL